MSSDSDDAKPFKMGCYLERGTYGVGRVTFVPKGEAAGENKNIKVEGEKADKLLKDIGEKSWTDNMLVKLEIKHRMARKSPDMKREYNQDWIMGIELIRK